VTRAAQSSAIDLAAYFGERAACPTIRAALPTDLHWLTIADAARLIERRRLSPGELTEAVLARVAAFDPQPDAFLLPTPEKTRVASANGKARDHGRRISRPAARNTVRAEGHLCDGRDPNDQPIRRLKSK
jgi:hypothetical protein